MGCGMVLLTVHQAQERKDSVWGTELGTLGLGQPPIWTWSL